MVVCPTCRETNGEDRAVCQKCGTSLEPGAVALPPRRSDADRIPIEIRKPEPPPRWRAVVVFAAIVGMILGAGAYLLFRRIENRIRMMHGRSDNRLPDDPDLRGELTRRLGLEDDLDAWVQASKTRVHEVYTRIWNEAMGGA